MLIILTTISILFCLVCLIRCLYLLGKQDSNNERELFIYFAVACILIVIVTYLNSGSYEPKHI